eukprot:scaffold3201_cov39-Phaeocystis_antarctica.AAC.2
MAVAARALLGGAASASNGTYGGVGGVGASARASRASRAPSVGRASAARLCAVTKPSCAARPSSRRT